MIDLDAIRAAAARLDGHVLRTPLVEARALAPVFDPRSGAGLGIDLHLKLETLQMTGSFKERGALNKLLTLEPGQARRGVVAASAGNHAQGLAHHATRLGIPVTIVMPEATPFVKVERTRQLGATVRLAGADYSAAEAVAAELAAQGSTLVHPYDDAAVIAGQGTIGLELLEDDPALDTLLVPIGGGGLIAGIATAAKAIKPSIRIVGIQVASYAAMAAVIAGRPIACGGATLAEGIAVKTPGLLTRGIVAELVDEIRVVEEAEIEAAIQLLAERQHVVAEGAGAAGIAALLRDGWRDGLGRTAAIICGGNVDGRILASILMRGLVRSGRMIRIRSEISDLPGSLARFTEIIGRAGGNIVEILHQRLFLNIPVKNTEVDVVLETRSEGHAAEILAALREGGFPARQLQDIDNG